MLSDTNSAECSLLCVMGRDVLCHAFALQDGVGTLPRMQCVLRGKYVW